MAVELKPLYYVLLASVSLCLAFDVYNVDDSPGVERRFDGIGGLSGGGATSKLLVNYPKEQRDQILDYLFKPNFGASLHILKVEIGGDAQSTDGSEASHMHNAWDENYQRGYEWWLMVEAKKRNPDILLYCLPWAFPAWIGDGTRSPYHNPKLTGTYVVKFIQGAKTHYNLTFDYVGIWNERPYNTKYIMMLRSLLDEAGFQHTQIVASDSFWEPISTEVLNDPSLAKDVTIIGTHYPGTKSTDTAQKTGKQLWASEDYSTYNDNVGAGCWARILNQNYVNGFMTSTISWNLIASYYENLPFERDGLMTAVSPWSGFYSVESPIWVSAHTTQFTQPGWSYLKHGSGVSLLKKGGSIVTFVSPDKSQFTIVMETMSHNHSLCVRPALPEYITSAQNVTLKLGGSFVNIKKVYVWQTKLAFDGSDSTLFKSLGSYMVVNGIVNINLDVDEVYTITTLDTGVKGEYPEPPADKPFPLPYTDNFESYPEFQEPFNFANQVGSFEVTLTSDPFHNKVLSHVVLENPIFWCLFIDLVFPIGVIGNYKWSDIYVEVDTRVGPVNGSTGAFVAARVDKGGCNTVGAQGIYFFIFPDTQTYQVTRDLARVFSLKDGSSGDIVKGWNNLGLLVKDGFAVGSLNKKLLFNVTLPTKYFPQNGFVGLGTSSYGLTDYDNLKIMSSEDGLELMRQRELNTLLHISSDNYLNDKFKVDYEINVPVDETLKFEPYQKKNRRGKGNRT